MKYGEQRLPAKPLQVALYLAYLMQKSTTSAQAVNAISWVHLVALISDPTRNELVQNVLAGAKCMLAHKTTKKEPITPEILLQLVEVLQINMLI